MLVPAAGWWAPDLWAMGQPTTAQNHSALPGAEWPTESVQLRDGRTLRGLIESEDDAWIHLIQVRRPRGRPMHLVIRPVERASVGEVARLQPQQRTELRQRIDRFLNRARIEAARMDAVPLGIVTAEGNHYQHYRGKWFTLDGTVDELTTRRIIVRIEQFFTAYRQVLAPRTESRRPLRLVIFGSMDEYHTFLRRLGKRLRNQACFFQEENLVVAGSELTRFAAMLAAVNAQHQRLRDELDQLQKQLPVRLAEIAEEFRQQGVADAEIAKLLRVRRVRFQKEIEQKQSELQRCNRENARKFDEVTRRTFVRLYHEAFHAYLENYVYPHRTHQVPRWLNEGLAMVCEGGLLEADALRVDAPDGDLLKRLKAALAQEDSLTLKRFLSAESRAQPPDSDEDRFYVYSWGLAYYLTFEKHLFSSPALEKYVRRPSHGVDVAPIERFEELVGMPVAEFEKVWREYVRELP